MLQTLFASALPSHVSFVALDATDGEDFAISPEEEALIGPNASMPRRRDFRLGRRAAYLALMHLASEGGPILQGADRQPIWPEGIVGSIAHAGGYAMAAVADRSRCGGLGIDSEHRDRHFPGLAAEIATEDEMRRLARLRGPRREDATIEMFSAKESLYKAFYPRVGRYFGFDSASIEVGPVTGPMTGHFLKELDPGYPPDRPLAIQCLWSGSLVFTAIVLPPD